MSKQYEFGFVGECVKVVGRAYSWSWYVADGTKLKARQSYEAWLEYFTPLSGNGGAL